MSDESGYRHAQNSGRGLVGSQSGDDNDETPNFGMNYGSWSNTSGYRTTDADYDAYGDLRFYGPDYGYSVAGYNPNIWRQKRSRPLPPPYDRRNYGSSLDSGYGQNFDYGHGNWGTRASSNGSSPYNYDRYDQGRLFREQQRRDFGPFSNQRQENYTGRGPKNYKRSDERIKDEVCERLSRDPEVDASDIEIEVSDGEVMLAGTVGERHEKRLAQDLAEDVWGVKDVRNNIRVDGGAPAHNAQSEQNPESRTR